MEVQVHKASTHCKWTTWLGSWALQKGKEGPPPPPPPSLLCCTLQGEPFTQSILVWDPPPPDSLPGQIQASVRIKERGCSAPSESKTFQVTVPELSKNTGAWNNQRQGIRNLGNPACEIFRNSTRASSIKRRTH